MEGRSLAAETSLDTRPRHSRGAHGALFLSGGGLLQISAGIPVKQVADIAAESEVQRAPDGQKQVDYTMKIKLFTIDGELKGQWSDDLSLFKSR